MAEFVDPYIDGKTGILRNLVGAESYKELSEAEANIIALAEISLSGIERTNDLVELRKIHKALFGKIYDWAGEIRTVDLKKGSEEYFLFRGQINTGAEFVFGELKKEQYLRGLDLKIFVKSS